MNIKTNKKRGFLVFYSPWEYKTIEAIRPAIAPQPSNTIDPNKIPPLKRVKPKHNG